MQALHRDTLAYRAKIGVVVPATNTVVQPEYESMRPRGVTHHVSRMFLPPRPYDDMAMYKKLLETEEGNLDAALDLLLPCEPAVIAHGHSIHSFRGDAARAADEQAALSKRCGVPFFTPSMALVEGLRAIGAPKKVAILTPYWPPADELIANWFRSAGFDVVQAGGLKTTGPTNVARVERERIFEGFRMIDDPKAEALLHVGTNLPVTAFTEQIERRAWQAVDRRERGHLLGGAARDRHRRSAARVR